MKAVLFALFVISGASAQKILFLSINQKCRNETEPWFCKKSSSCKSLKEGINDGKLEICSFSGVEPIICCPPDPPISNNTDKASQSVTVSNSTDEKTGTPLPNAGKKAEKMCQEYSKYVYQVLRNPILTSKEEIKISDCAVTAETLIVGGTPAKLKEFPHMALIGLENKPWIDWYCGGSLISPQFILTAAHCNVSQNIEKTVVRLGDLNIKDKSDHARHRDVKVAEVFDHPLYKHQTAYHDISLLKLTRDVPLGPGIRPLCLHTSTHIKHQKGIASGWGRTFFGGPSSDLLQKVNLPLVSNDKCKNIYAFERSKLPQGINPDLILCAGGEAEKDTCQGDSGGPLQVAVKEPYCMYSQIGVTAFGVECGSKIPGGYTRVSHYVPWIENIVWPE